MAIDMPLVFSFLIYALYVSEGISIIQYDYYYFFWGGGWWLFNLIRLQQILLMLESPLLTSETFLCFMLIHPLKIVSPDVPLRQIRFVVVEM